MKGYAVIALAALIAALGGCGGEQSPPVPHVTAVNETAGGDLPRNVVSDNDADSPATIAGDDSPGSPSDIGKDDKHPPLPAVRSQSSIDIPVVQSSYCWGKLGCADYLGGPRMMDGKTPPVVPAGASIAIHFDYKPQPTELQLGQTKDGQSWTGILLKDGAFRAPDPAGVYYYTLSAYWKSADGKYSLGDTSVVFAIEVRQNN